MSLIGLVSDGRSISLWLCLVAAIPICTHSAVGTLTQDPMSVPDQVMWRGVDELAIANNAMIQAKASGKSGLVTQQELLAQQADEVADEPYKKVSGLVPQARAEVLKVRHYAFLAAQHRDHAQQVQNAWRGIAADAAAEARKAVEGWVAADAAKSAETSATIDNRGDRLAAAVAAAAEPYHLAILRNQKFCAETYNKAKTAFSSAQKLIADAKALSLRAQDLQAIGNPDGMASMGVASGMMRQAEDLRLWSAKLYKQANTACGSTGAYTMSETQAATNAAATTIINAPMKLPPAL